MAQMVYLGLGSNLGDRARLLKEALAALRREGVEVLRISSVYESAPVGPVKEQPSFLNAVAELHTELEPDALLSLCLGIEGALGRVREKDKGPRTIDLDLLLAGDAILSSSELELPHPALTERAFVLGPLLELSPELADPRDGRPLVEHLARVAPTQPMRRVDDLMLR
ncbi:MAG: 2-amino-4-hydroxy-6-hydroxymethyldihydropteridine diphosphokinase [Proteobacteria bacterium]|nr:MAG: 2-amino-4-hydroxy-6-hydroxymethyldihydropteridine diphosphokinase [Pseudomonadota bacterium]